MVKCCRQGLSAKLAGQSALDAVEPGSIHVHPICSHGSENRGPEAKMRGAIGFALNPRQAGLANQGLRRKQFGNLTKPQCHPRDLTSPPLVWHVAVFEADQLHDQRLGVAVAVEMDPDGPVTEQSPVTQPVGATVNDPEVQFLDEAKRCSDLYWPPVSLWNIAQRPALAHDSESDSNVYPPNPCTGYRELRTHLADSSFTSQHVRTDTKESRGSSPLRPRHICAPAHSGNCFPQAGGSGALPAETAPRRRSRAPSATALPRGGCDASMAADQ